MPCWPTPRRHRPSWSAALPLYPATRRCSACCKACPRVPRCWRCPPMDNMDDLDLIRLFGLSPAEASGLGLGQGDVAASDPLLPDGDVVPALVDPCPPDGDPSSTVSGLPTRAEPVQLAAPVP